MSGSGGVAPTGCYKCGRPGHWSRDCPSSNPDPNSNSNSGPSPLHHRSSTNASSMSASKLGPSSAQPKPMKAPRTRPKLTPDLLLSDQGLGYILRYFPKNFKYRGRGNEVNDLGNLLRMYAEWHAQLIPYFPFDQFIHKVEDAGSRRVKMCIAELKERVAKGGDPTKLKEAELENETLHDNEDVLNVGGPATQQDNLPFNNDDADEMQEDIFNEIFHKTAEQEPSNSTHMKDDPLVADIPASKHSEQSQDDTGTGPSVAQVTEEQQALMEAKRLKALEKAAARSRLLKPS